MGYCQRQSLFKAVRIFPFPFKPRIIPALAVLSIAVWGTDIVRVCTVASGLGDWARLVAMWGGKWCGERNGACRASFSLGSCLRVAGVYCCGAFGLCCCCFQEQPGRNSPRGKKYHHGRKEAIIAGCLFVANRMLKWQICKFVREGSLVFIFISQSGFLLAEQQARKRPILTT